MSESAKAWAVLGLGVVTYDLLAPEGETLSEGFKRGMEHPVYKYMCVGLLGGVALHLLELYPDGRDPISGLFKAIKH